MTTLLQTVWDWRLPKRCYLSMCLKGLQSCRLSNFFHFSKIVHFFLCIIFSYENSTTYEHFWLFEILKLWQPVTLKPLGAGVNILANKWMSHPGKKFSAREELLSALAPAVIFPKISQPGKFSEVILPKIPSLEEIVKINSSRNSQFRKNLLKFPDWEYPILQQK